MDRKLALILDDNEQKAELISIWLSQYGVDSHIVNSYNDAMARAMIKYDFIIVDYFLDGKNVGPDFTHFYQKTNVGCHVWLYSAFPEKIEQNSNIIDFNMLHDFLAMKLRPKISQEFFPSDIYVVNQEESFDQINTLTATMKNHHKILNKHNNKIAAIENLIFDLQKSMFIYRNIGMIITVLMVVILIIIRWF